MNAILNSVYVLYAVVVFVIPMPFILAFFVLTSWMPDGPRLRLAYRANWYWIKSWQILVGMTFHVSGHSRIDPNQSYVFVGNHTNMLDVLIAGSNIMHPLKSLVKKEIVTIPILGQLIQLISIPVDRSSKESRQKSLQLMVRNLHDGISILVFPEGTRNRTDQVLKRFYPGAFATAIKAQVPIMPFVIYNHRHLQPIDTYRLYPGEAHLVMLDPIPTEGMTEADIPVLSQRVYQLLEEKLLAWDETLNPLAREFHARA
ncbi:MAG: lysophospholipid acyltransferase family protein [Bacteroidota bacterium]